MTRYKTADYRLFDVDGHDFLFLADSCAVFEVETEMKALLEKGRSLIAFTREEVLRGLPRPVEKNYGNFEELLSTGAILSEGRNLHPRERDPYMEIPIRTLVLQITDACNLNCGYCYGRNKTVEPALPMNMSDELARRSVDFLFARSGNQKVLTVVFFGGEPLLRFDLIRDIVGYAREKAVREEKTVIFSITTNGTLLDGKMIEFLSEQRISVTISMDGDEKAHDRHRCFYDGSPSYEVILPKIEDLFRKMGNTPVAARATVTEDGADITGRLNHLLNLGFAEAGFAPATTRDFRFQVDEDGMAGLLRQFASLGERFIDFARKDELLGFSNLIDLLVAIHEGEIRRYPCGAGLGLFCVDPRGRLYLCQRLVGEEGAHMGDIEQGVDKVKAMDFYTRVKRDRESICGRCWVRHVCAGGCYQEALVREQAMTAPNTHYCRWIKEWTEVGLLVYGRLAIERPDYLDRLSRLRGH